VGLCEAKAIPVVRYLDRSEPLVHGLEAHPHEADSAFGPIGSALGAQPHACQPKNIQSCKAAPIVEKFQPRASRSGFEAHVRSPIVDGILEQLEEIQIVARKLLLEYTEKASD